MTVDGALASNDALGLVLAGTLGVAGWRNRYFLRELATDQGRFWRAISVLSAGSLAAFVGWATFLDNWRQLTGVPFRAIQHFPSKRVEFRPPSSDVRHVTYVLLALSLVLMACMFARHVGGYGTQLALLFPGLTCWLPLFVVRLRLGISLALGTGDDSVAGIAGFAAFLLVSWLFDIALIITSYLTLLVLTALPVTLVLDVLRLRRPRVTGEADAFFGAVGERARRSV